MLFASIIHRFNHTRFSLKIRKDRDRGRILIHFGFLCTFFLFISGIASGQPLTEEWMKAEYILLLSGYVGWEDEAAIDTFQIGVLGSEDVYTPLSFRSESRDFKNKPFKVLYYKRASDIAPVHILYIPENRNTSLRKIWNRWGSSQVLIISDSSSTLEYSMINLLRLSMGGKPFEINKSNIDAAGLAVSSRILAVGGSEDDLRTIYRASERELDSLRLDISKLNDELLDKQDALEQSIHELHQRMQEIELMNTEINEQTRQLEDLTRDVELRRKDLEEKQDQLTGQEVRVSQREEEINTLNREIREREEEIRIRSETMAEQQKNIREQRILMNEQQAILNAQTIQIRWQKNALVFFIMLSVLVLLMGFFIYRAYRIKKRANRILREKNRIIQDQNKAILSQKEEISAQRDQLQQVNNEIEKKNENITASIYYALTIQQAILPDEQDINRHFSAFVIYYPKDIVSGDFYWYSQPVRRKTGEEMSFIAVVDCTGHGVPGGFLSMIGARLLSAIINENKIYETDRILELMDQRLRQALNQQKTANDDGMDISLCKIVRMNGGNDDPEVYLSFSGARQHLYLVRNHMGVEIIKSSRRTIGGKYFNPEPFIKNELILKPGDILYLSTDGLIDQHSPDRHRFGTSRLTSLLDQHKDLPMAEQKQKLEEEMIGFMKTEKQRDDITIVGIKL